MDVFFSFFLSFLNVGLVDAVMVEEGFSKNRDTKNLILIHDYQ